MRFLIFCTAFFLSAFSHASDWQDYPPGLPSFDYAGERLQQHWPQLNLGTAQPWPDTDFFYSMLQQYPQLREYSLNLARQPGAHPALQALLQDDLQPLAAATQQVWRLHYQGQFQQAYELGMQLGPAGAVPALYAKLMHAALLTNDPERKLTALRI